MRTPIVLLAFMTVACACTARTTKFTDPDEIPASPKLPEGDGLGTPLGDLCQHLRDIKCKEGLPKTANGKTSTCYQALTVATRTAPIDVKCSMDAQTPEAIRACGDPRTNTTIRCNPP